MGVPVRALDPPGVPDPEAEFSILLNSGQRLYDPDGIGPSAAGPEGEFDLPVPSTDYREI